MKKSVNAQIPRKLQPLLAPSRYKAAYGGRGSGKSHFFAQAIVLQALARPGFRAVCIREVQRSLGQSVKQLIEDKIEALGVGDQFEVLQAEIKTPGGGLIIFQGMQNHTADSIKSLEGFDVAYVEEAQSLSEHSMKLLRPTIRKPDSELWFAWNPRHDTDAVDKFFRSAEPPHDAIIVEVNWQDNPWFPDVLRNEKDHDYNTNPELAAHVWGGGYEIITEGAYYAKDLAELEAKGQIGAFPFDPERKVITGWDLGVDDYTAIWFFQTDGKKVRVIDYYETNGDGADLIVETAIDSKDYTYEKHYLPHDVKVREWGAGARERYLTLMDLGMKNIIPGVPRKPEERIASVRSLLPKCYFDKNKNVQAGLKRLRRYQRKWNEGLGTYQGPKHDDASHAADAFGEFAVNAAVRLAPAPVKAPRKDMYDKAFERDEDALSWMTA